jgi:hypothetical protein
MPPVRFLECCVVIHREGDMGLVVRETRRRGYGSGSEQDAWVDVASETPTSCESHASYETHATYETTLSQRAPTSPDADVIEALGDEIATLAAHIAAATHRLLALIAQFDRLRGWQGAGHRSCAHWLSFRTGIDLGAAREKVRAARALEQLPQTSAAMAAGELSFSQVRALTRVAEPETEAALLDLARGATTSQLERMVRAWKRGTRLDEAAAERARFAARTLSIFPDDDGMHLVRGRVPPEVGVLLMRAIDAAADALFPAEDPTCPRDPEQRRADALALVAARALEAGFGNAAVPAAAAEDSPAELPAGPTPAPPISGTRAARYQVVLHVETATLQRDSEPGRSELEDGSRVSAETSRRLSCDCALVRVRRDAEGGILDVGRRTRTIPPALRRALEVRDRGCRFPGCGLRFADAHHVEHWADGGETSLRNCVLLCGHHHRLVHEGDWRVQWWGEGRPVFIDPAGGEHFDGRWRPPYVEDGAAAVIEANRRRGITPHSLTIGARWRREADIPDEIYYRASEAL